MRIGYIVAHADNIKKLNKYQIPWSVNAVAQQVAQMMLEYATYRKASLEMIEKERSFLLKELGGFDNLQVYSPAANYILLKVMDKKPTSHEIRKECIDKGILIRDCANFRGLNQKFIRIAVRTRKENKVMLKIMKTMFQEK